jgi:putative transposase
MTRKQYSAQFKAKVVVEAIRGVRPVNELAARFGVHPVQIAHWKKQALEGIPGIFNDRRGSQGRSEEALSGELYQQIGRLKMELEWLKKKSGLAD